ncbi:MAG: hypothetical protein SVY41_02465, partial [Candidatus Nanohaloarchaea archaeon]|nr:hypothetical protein [Candidatus Nanohaloarchaea archaeon]
MDALRAEIERNLEMADAAKTLIGRERDMLQGEVRERIVLHTFHTDAWHALVNAGRMDELGDAEEDVSRCYMYLDEVNEVVDWFEQYGNRRAFLPLVPGGADGYGRKEMLQVLREKYDEAEIKLRDARQAV